MLLGLAVMALAAASATRIRLADDARALVAGGDPEVAQQLDALSEFTAIDSLLLQLDSGGHSSELDAAGPALVAALMASNCFTDARFEAEPARQLELVAALMPRRFILDPRPTAELFAPAALDQALATTRQGLLAPEGVIMKQYLLRDPLGSMAAALKGLGTAPGLSKLDASSGRFLSQDGQSLLVIANPKGNPFAGKDAARTMAAVDQATQELKRVAPDVIVRAIGAHRYAHDAQLLVQHDVNLNTFMTILAIIIIFLIFFRKPRLLIVAFPPLLFGTALAGGIAGALGRPVHGIVLAFAGACLGLAVDYTIYLITSTAAVGGPPATALPIAARRIGRSLYLAMATTVAGLLALLASRIPAIQQMGLLAMGAVVGSFLGALLWVPILLPLVSRGLPVTTSASGPWTSAVRYSMRYPRLIVAAALAVALAFSCLALRTTVDGDIRHLDTHTALGEADLTAFTQSFGDTTTTGLALVAAPTLGAALTTAAQVEQTLKAAKIERVLSLTSLAPPPGLAKTRQQDWCANRESLLTRLREAAVRQGFRPDAFTAFAADLALLCGPQGDAVLAPEPALSAFSAIVGRPVVHANPGGGVRLAVAFELSDKRFPEVRASLARIAGTTIVHRGALNSRLVELVIQDLPRLAGISLVLVAALMLVSFRNLRQTCFALVPCLLAVATFLGIFALTKTPLNVMNLSVFALLNGAGVDYGILMVDADPSGGAKDIDNRALGILVASLCTLAGFGSLATAHYYAIATIGYAVLLAIGSAAFYALLVTPALVAWSAKRVKNRHG